MVIQSSYDLGSGKHVFIDWSLIEPGYGVAWAGKKPESWEMPSGVRLAVHKPRIDPEPLFPGDRPWEASIGVHTSVFEDRGRYRLYYKCSSDWPGNENNPASAMLAYAESTDGVNWIKPNIGAVELDGSTDNNIVYGIDVARGRAVNSPIVFKDFIAETARRYKLVYRAREGGRPCLYGAVSSDGLHWDTFEEPVLSDYLSDTHNVVGFDPRRGKYVGYFRGWTAHERGMAHGRRTIAYADTYQFEKWPRPVTMVSADIHDGPCTDIYTNSYSPWPDADAYLMFPAYYRRDLDVTEVHMLTSRDGLGWEHPVREAIVACGEPDSGAEGGCYAGAGLVNFRPGEVSILITPVGHTHNQSHYLSGVSGLSHKRYICRATWRQDGFMSLEAEAEGSCSTIPVAFTGERLEVNAWTRFGGEIRFELADAGDETMGRPAEREYGSSARPIAGRTFRDCDPITGDHLKHTVTWQGQSDVSSRAGRPVRLRIYMRRARLYAIRFCKEQKSVTK